MNRYFATELLRLRQQSNRMNQFVETKCPDLVTIQNKLHREPSYEIKVILDLNWKQKYLCCPKHFLRFIKTNLSCEKPHRLIIKSKTDSSKSPILPKGGGRKPNET